MGKYETLVTATRNIIAQYRTRLTLRQIFYRLVAAHIIPNTVNEYNSLSKILVKARLEGAISFTSIEDRTRSFQTSNFYRISDYLIGEDPYLEQESRDPDKFYEDALNFTKNCWEYFHLPRWKDQPKHVEVWLEKQALAGIFSVVARKLETPFAACRGYPSLTYLYEGGQRLEEVAEEKEIIILYFGDYDPSGEDIQRYVNTRLADLREMSNIDFEVEVRKIAITSDQIQQYNIPPMPAKRSDPRAERFIAEHGDVAVELDALDPDILERLIEESCEREFDQTVYRQVKEEEAKGRERVKKRCDSVSG